jgi:3-phosphoglycerate kinase
MDLSDIKNKIVLVKVDYNLPSMSDTFRIKSTKETMLILKSQYNKIVIMTHFGRPEGVIDHNFSTFKLLPAIEDMLDMHVDFIDQYESLESTKTKILNSQHQFILLENTRFHPDEETEDVQKQEHLAFSYSLLGDVLVDEAFSLSHRKECTNSTLKKYMPYALGFQYKKEIVALEKIKNSSHQELTVIMGGAKLETKLELLVSMLPKAKNLLLGGLICFTFLKAAQLLNMKEYEHVDLTHARIDESFVSKAKELLILYKDKIILPKDFVYGEENGVSYPADIGENSLELFMQSVVDSKFIFWNGPLGRYEMEPFGHSTQELASFISQLVNSYKVLGGGDITAAVDSRTQGGFDFVSTGGGATLAYLAKTR